MTVRLTSPWAGQAIGTLYTGGDEAYLIGVGKASVETGSGQVDVINRVLHTARLGDRGRVVSLTSASATTVRIPTAFFADADTGMIGTYRKDGAGTVTVAADDGTAIASLTTLGQTAVVRKLGGGMIAVDGAAIVAMPYPNYPTGSAAGGDGGGQQVPIVTPLPAATYLPAAAGTPAVAYGMRRLVTAYSGPLIQVQRASDNATMDVAQTVDGLPDSGTVAAWANGSQVTIRTWYNQTGVVRHALNAAVAEQPIFDAAGTRGAVAAFGQIKAAMFDGWLDFSTGQTRRPKRLNIPVVAGQTFDFYTHSAFAVIDPKTALYNDVYFALAGTSGGQATAIGTAAAINGVYSSGGPGNSVSGRRPRQAYQTLGYTSSTTAVRYFIDGAIQPSSVKWQDTIASAVIGDSIPGGADFLSEDNWLGFVIYPTALSDTLAGQVRDALNSNFGITAPTGAQVVRVGDSIEYGPTVTESLEGRTSTRVVRPLLKGSPALYGMGLSSQLLRGTGQLADLAPSREFALVDTNYARRVLFIEIGTNDIGASTTGATLYSSMATYITAARTAGYTHIVLATLLPRGGGFTTEIANYNALVRANSAGADSIADRAAHPVMGSQANVTNTLYYQGDSLHPTGLGLSLLAQTDATAINSVLP